MDTIARGRRAPTFRADARGRASASAAVGLHSRMATPRLRPPQLPDRVSDFLVLGFWRPLSATTWMVT